MTKKALGANELLCDNHNNQVEQHVFLALKNDLFMIANVWFYDKVWYIIKIKYTCESYAYHAIILLLKVRLISTSISIIGPLSFHHSHISHNNSFASKAFLVIGDVHLALFALRSL